MKNTEIQITECSGTLAWDLPMNEMGHHPWMSSVARDVTVMFAIMQWKKHFFVLNSGRSADHAHCNVVISAYIIDGK